MDETNDNIATEATGSKVIHPKHKTHNILAHSYSVYFLLLIVGVVLDLLVPILVFNIIIMISVGFILLILATILIIWAQHTSRRLNTSHPVTKETFCKGPYCYTRTPTHWGLFFLILGFGFIMNTFFIIILTILAFIITKLFFLKKQESVLTDRYRKAYLEYKKEVKF